MFAQSAIEFMMIFMIFLLLLSIGALVSMEKTKEISNSQIGLEITKVLNDAVNKINIAFLEGSGFSMNLTLPENIFGMTYSIDTESNYILLTFNNITYSKHILTQNITGNLSPGTNLIRNENGEIIIS